MPHLKYYGRVLHIAGDELAIPALCSISGRAFWVVLMSIAYGVSYQTFTDCNQDGWVQQFYLLGSIVLFTVTIVCELFLIHVSTKGSITIAKDRDELGKHLTFKIGLTVVQILWAIFGILATSLQKSIPCDESLLHSRLALAFISIVIISQLIDGTLLFCCCYCLTKNVSEDDSLDETGMVTIWETRCQQFTRALQILCCNTFGGGNVEEGFDQVARVLTTFFHHNGVLDVVPSDVVAGIVLVRLEQRFNKPRGYMTIEEYNRHRSRIISNSILEATESGMHSVRTENPSAGGGSMLAPLRYTNNDMPPFSSDGEITMQEIENWSRCMVFSLAIYSHLLAVYMHPCTGVCRMGLQCCPEVVCCLPIRPRGRKRSLLREVLVEGDNCCSLNRAGLTVFTKLLDNTELLYVSFRNDTTHKPYGVFLDHDKEWLVVAVRGTLSLEDCITDVTCEPVEMTEAGEQWGFDGRNRWAHGGMLRAAIHIRSELQRTGLLRQVYGTSPSSSFTTPLTEASYGHYKLVVTGHSLGAGTAVLLAYLLRQEFPSVRCIAFGVPASVLDERSAREVVPYVTSVVLGNDLVSRLNFQALVQLRNEVLEAIARAKVNKMVVMRTLFMHNIHPADLMHARGEEPDTPFKASLQSFKEEMALKLARFHGLELKIPGRIVHLEKVIKAKDCCKTKSRFLPYVKHMEDFQHIFVSPTMGADHFPDRYYYELLALKKTFMSSGMDV